MKRLKLLLAILGLTGLLAGTVALCSPYAPVVQPAPEIEEIWAIEDTRKESWEPLVTALENHGNALAYDSDRNTFYCTIGLDHTEAWPDIHLTAPQAKGVKLMFVDDYSYDWCQDAVYDGYPYQVLAYTDDEFWYFDLVFTGLPLVMIECGEEITRLDTPARVTVSAFGEKAAQSTANIHLRGGGSLNQEKKNYRVEFTRGANGKKNMISLPGFGVRENILLNPMVFDETMLRDRISWALYDELLGKDYDSAFDARRTAYAEVFLNGQYQGVYLMMEPVNAQEELAKAGGSHVLTDSVYRSLRQGFVDERPVTENPIEDHAFFELRHEPDQSRQFAALEGYLDLISEMDEDAFAKKAERMDLESVVRYVLLRQIAGLDDNVNNNLYIWARHTPEGIRYTLAPWDMDMSWGNKTENLGDSNERWLAFTPMDRILRANALGAADLLAERWRQWRGDVFTQEHIAGLVQQYAAELENSGALVRNADRWETPAYSAADELSMFASDRIEALDTAIAMFEDDSMEYPAFLEHIGPEINSYSIYGE